MLQIHADEHGLIIQIADSRGIDWPYRLSARLDWPVRCTLTKIIDDDGEDADGDSHTVEQSSDCRLRCSCKSFRFRTARGGCKHTLAILELIALHKHLQGESS